MSTGLWLASFLYLTAISAWITSAVKDESDGPETYGRAVSFFGLVVGATVGFAAVILVIQKIF
jgi:hypothetical protein